MSCLDLVPTIIDMREDEDKSEDIVDSDKLEVQIAKMINRQLQNENKQVNHRLHLLEQTNQEIRDYAKEEAEKMRTEMQ